MNANEINWNILSGAGSLDLQNAAIREYGHFMESNTFRTISLQSVWSVYGSCPLMAAEQVRMPGIAIAPSDAKLTVSACST